GRGGRARRARRLPADRRRLRRLSRDAHAPGRQAPREGVRRLRVRRRRAGRVRAQRAGAVPAGAAARLLRVVDGGAARQAGRQTVLLRLSAAGLGALVLAGAALADASDPKQRFTKAGQARAAAAVLARSDLGSAWTGGPRTPTSLKAPKCPAYT